MNQRALIIGNTYEAFNPKYGTFTGKLVELEDGDAIIEHIVAGLLHETSCNLSYCSLTPTD